MSSSADGRNPNDLRIFGFFKELPDGDPAGVSLYDNLGPISDPDLIANYLAAGSCLAAAAGSTSCVIADCEHLPLQVLTDGTWRWPATLAHYVRCHGVTLPDEMIEHIATTGPQPPTLSDKQLIELSNRLLA